jgi:hypothetical protein
MATVLKAGAAGPRVLALQTLLTHNVTGRRFYHGRLDGEFAGLTGQACVRAKFILGYAVRGCQPVAGDLLIAFLSGKRKTTPAMQARAHRRAQPKPKPPEKTMQQKALAYMHAHIGEHESPPGSNHCPATVEWGHGDIPWCCVLCSLSYIHAGSTAFSAKAYRHQSVPALLADAQAGRNGLSITHSPAHGDLVVWNYPGGSAADHVTEFDEWLEGHTIFSDIGGNEGTSGIVKRDVNHVTYVRAFIRVGH